MKLLISSFLLAAFTTISNAGASCSLNTALSDTCGSITISGVNNAYIDGTYNKIDDSLYQKTDGSANYLSYWYGNGGKYVGNEIGDVRCESDTGNFRVIFDASEVDNMVVGEAESLIPAFPSGRTVQIVCNTASNEQAPAPAPVQGLGSLCFSTEFTGTLTSGSGITITLSKLAGQYVEISGGINGRPAYELVNEGSDCSLSSTLMYASDYGEYMFVRNRNQPGDTYYFGCANTATITDNDVTQCEFGSVDDIVTLTQGTSCQCGRTTPAPTIPAPVQGLGSLCLSTSYTGTLNSGSGISIEVSKLAGQYTEISGGLNGRPAYELVNSGTGCSAASTLMYVPNFGKYMFVRNSGNPVDTYYFSCSNTDSISGDDVTQCEFGNLDSHVALTQGTSCQCGRTTPSPTTPSPVEVVPIEGDNLCYAVLQAKADLSYSVNGVELTTIAGQYSLVTESDENNKPVYQLSGCPGSAYIKYSSYYQLYMVVTDVNDPEGSFVTYCQNSATITNNDIRQCVWTRGENYVITDELVSCSCGQTVPSI